MAGYDPKRSRPPAAEVDVDEPAPVDALLRSAPIDLTEPAPAPAPVDDAVTAPAIAAPVDAPIPVDVPVAPAPDRRTARLAIVGGVAAATVAGIMLLRRIRRR